MGLPTSLGGRGLGGDVGGVVEHEHSLVIPGPVLVGSLPERLDKSIVQAATSVVLTNVGGSAGITFPSPFPNGLITIIVANGDGNVGSFRPSLVAWSLSAFTVYAEQVNSTVRLNWVALGW